MRDAVLEMDIPRDIASTRIYPSLIAQPHDVHVCFEFSGAHENIENLLSKKTLQAPPGCL